MNQLFHKVHAAVTLTGAAVYSTQQPLFGNSEVCLHTLYAPGVTNDANVKANVTVQVSGDTLETAAASSTWITVGTTSNTSGTLTFTPSTLKFVGNTTVLSGDWSMTVQGKKFRVGILEEGSPSPFGVITVWAFHME